MIRESLDPSAAFAYMVATPGSGVSFGWRQIFGGTCTSATQAGIAAPQWVKLVRAGDVIIAQYSADGTVASAAVTMTGTIYAGLCATATVQAS